MTIDSVDINLRFQRALANLSKTAASSFVDVDAGKKEPTQTEDTLEVPKEDQSVSIVKHTADTPIRLSNLFQHPDAHPIVLDLALLKKYGPEWMEWESETMALRVSYDYGQELGDISGHKIQAAKTLHFVDSYWESWEVFLWVTMALNGVPPDFTIMQVPTVAQCAVSVDIANRIRQDVPFSSELNDYIEQVHMHDGIFVPIEPLTFVTMDDVEDYPVDVEEVKKLWPAVRKTGKEPTAETVVAEQHRRMLGVREYLEESRSLLRAQLPVVLDA